MLVFRTIRRFVYPLLLLLLALVYAVVSHNDGSCTVNDLVITVPKGFNQTASNTNYAKWEYKEKDKKPGILILDAQIKGERGQQFSTADEVLQDCDWMTDAELYVNPQGIRMARGFSMQFSGYPERRYYVESAGAVFLLRMIEDSRYYDSADCEEAMKQTVDGIRRK